MAIKATNPLGQRTNLMVRSGAQAQRGFSIIELLVALIIIGILVTVIAPRVANRADEARLTRARADLEIIQNAQEKCVVDTNYFVRLHVLDDIAGIGDGIGPRNPQAGGDTIDALNDEFDNTSIFAQAAGSNPRRLFIMPAEGIFLQDGAAEALFDQLSLTDNETPFGQSRWGGPYLTYQVDSNHPNDGGPTYIGDDPYGNDYLFFTRGTQYSTDLAPGGLVKEPDGIIVQTITGSDFFSSFGGTAPSSLAGVTYDCTIFDRPTILSLGPNGAPGDGSTNVGPGGEGNFGKGDDIFRQF